MFSIIVPTRDRVDWLKRCLDGIAEQIYNDYEVVIVDDGSQPEVIEQYRRMVADYGPNFRLVEASKPGSRRLGPSLARNLGITESKGDYIAFCDDDDYWCNPDLLSVAAVALQQTGSELYFSNQRILRGEELIASGSFKNVTASLNNDQSLKDLPVYQIGRNQILTFPDYAHLNITIAKKSLLQEIGGFWEETRYAEDVDLFVRLCDAAEKILFRPDVCSVHNAPVQHDQESASKSVREIDRRLLEGSVYWHLLATCKTSEALRYASLSLSSNSKQLTGELVNRGNTSAGKIISRLAFAAKPSLKWGLYLAWLHFKSIFFGKDNSEE